MPLLTFFAVLWNLNYFEQFPVPTRLLTNYGFGYGYGSGSVSRPSKAQFSKNLLEKNLPFYIVSFLRGKNL
jgi:hypothetical protein